MSEYREPALEEQLVLRKHQEGLTAMIELLQLRRERYRDKLESTENPEMRGRAKECKDLLQIFG